MVVGIRFSKTDQKVKSVELRFHEQSHSALCAVSATLEYMHLRSPIAGPFLGGHFDHSPLTTFQFNRVLQVCLEALGLSHEGFSSHSFRIGAATSAALDGFSVMQIQQLGRWRSPAVIRPEKVS